MHTRNKVSVPALSKVCARTGHRQTTRANVNYATFAVGNVMLIF